MELYHALLNYMIAHIGLVFWLGLTFVVCSIIGTKLDSPKETDPLWYHVFFALTNGCAANMFRIPIIRKWLGQEDKP